MSELSSKILNSIENVIGKKNDINCIPLHEPYFEDTNAWKYVKNCIDTGWVSSSGDWIEKFEKGICSYTGSKYSIVVNNGTVGLRLALYVSGVERNDEVLIPPFSFVATANAVSHLGAIPHFIDIEGTTLSMCPKSLEKRLDQIAVKKEGKVFNIKTGRRIAALLPVHVFGIPANLSELLKISKSWGIPIIEDAAEALGSWFNISNKKKHCGLIGDLGVISFNGNKLITSGGGGVIITNNKELALRAKHLSRTAKINHPWEFDHDEIGWNYRMTNLQAAMGCGQLININKSLKRKREIGKRYISILKNCKKIKIQPYKNKYSTNIFWVFGVLLKKNKLISRDQIVKKLLEKNIQTRNFFHPMYKQKIFKKLKIFKKNQKFPISDHLSNNGFYLPSGLGLTNSEINYVGNTLLEILK